MAPIHCRLNQLIKQLSGGNIRDFAQKANIAYHTLYHQLKRKSDIPHTTLTQLCRRLGVSPQWLLLGKGEIFNPPDTPALKIVAYPDLVKTVKRATLPHLKAIPILTDAAAAGNPRSVNEHDVEDWAVIYDQWGSRPQIALRVAGDSMCPTLHDGDLVGVEINAADPRPLRRKIVAARLDDGVTIKRFISTDQDIILVPDNPDYDPIPLQGEPADVIIGPVIWSWHRLQ